MVRGLIIKVHWALFASLVFLVLHLSGQRPTDRRYFEAQERLIKKLVNSSEVTKEILPVENSSAPVVVDVNLGIRQISTVDEVNQAMRLNVWLRMTWHNPFLTWKPEDYNNVTSIHLDNAQMWTPDISMYNQASLEEDIGILYTRLSTQVILQYNGTCKWLCPVALLSQCRINVRDFPFDKQECLLTFGSWTYSALQIDVKAGGADIDNLVPNGEWDVLEHPMKRKVTDYSGVPYAEVTISFHIKRQPLYYTLNLILPCTVIAILAFMSFVLPSNHGERVSLVITVLLAMSVYMLIVSSTLPQTSDAMPVIGSYFLCIIVEIALCLLATCFVAKLREHDTEMPKWLDKLLNRRLARLLFMSTASDEDYESFSKIVRSNGHPKTVDVNMHETQITDKEEIPKQKLVLKLHEELAVLTNDVSKRQKRDAKKRKWERAAKVLDRFFLLFFSLVFVIITAAVFA